MRKSTAITSFFTRRLSNQSVEPPLRSRLYTHNRTISLTSLFAPKFTLPQILVDPCEQSAVDYVSHIKTRTGRDYSKLLKHGIGNVAAHFVPCATVSGIAAVEKFMILLFIYDDLMDNSVTQATKSNEIMKSTVPEQLLVEVVEELSQHVDQPDEWKTRFWEEFALYQQKQSQLTSMLNKFGRTIDLQLYQDLRIPDSAAPLVFCLFEPAMGRVIPSSILSDKRFIRLKDLSSLVCALTNDVCSYEKEVLKQGQDNMVSIVMEQLSTSDGRSSCSLERAVIYVLADLVQQYQSEFSLLSTQFRIENGDSQIREHVTRYINALYECQGGSWYWYLQSDRYKSTTSPFSELRIRI